MALVGVSDRPDSYGRALFETLRGAGFAGRILPVNPRLAELAGEPVFASLDELPETPEHVVLSLADERVLPEAERALARGAQALTVFARMPDPAARRRLGEMVREAGAVLCGPNTMGLHHLPTGLRITPFPAPLDRDPGGVGLVSQSGSVMGALLHNDRRLRLACAVGSGAETVVGASDYLAWMVERPEIRCVGLFLETVRDPEGFLGALERAAERDVPVVVLKVGRSPAAARMAVSHTGALVGDDAVFRAVVRRLGAHPVETLDELAATLQIFEAGRRPMAKAVASIHDSGGERELLADLAKDAGLAFAPLSAETRARLEAALEPGLGPDNPLDAWGTGRDAERSFAEAALALLEDPAVGVFLYVLDWREDYWLHAMHERVVTRLAGQTRKPLVAVSNWARTRDEGVARRLAAVGVPLVGGTREALVAVRALLDHGRPAAWDRRPAADPRAARWTSVLRVRTRLSEAGGYALLADWRIPVPAHRTARSAAEAVAAAATVGFPVALKTARADIAHKTEHGGVRLGLATAREVEAAWHDLAARLGGEVLVVEMLGPGSEWSVGARIDPQFGPVVRIAPGGTLVELLPESVLLPAPFEADEAEAAIRALRASRLLRGHRGGPPLALAALADIAARFSRLVLDLRDVLREAEINPVIVEAHRATAADVLLVGRSDPEPLDPRPAMS